MFGADTLAGWVQDARSRTYELVQDLDEAQLLGPILPIVNPLLWEIGHVSWFQEHWVLRHALGEPPIRVDGDALYDSAKVAHDTRWGGFGGAPKFPRASILEFLFRTAALQGPATDLGQAAIGVCAVTLQRMAEGGLHDHLGGGFHRYAVDAEWHVPHFEKMLYDQALIALNYLEAQLSVPIDWLSVGARRDQLIARRGESPWPEE